MCSIYSVGTILCVTQPGVVCDDDDLNVAAPATYVTQRPSDGRSTDSLAADAPASVTQGPSNGCGTNSPAADAPASVAQRPSNGCGTDSPAANALGTSSRHGESSMADLSTISDSG